MRKLYNVKDDLNNVLGAIGRFARAAVSNKQLLALVLLALVSLVSVVVLYFSDYRYSHGPWRTYESGLFSVNEGRNEKFEKFVFPDTIRREIEKRNGGRLLCAYQKSYVSDDGDVQEIQHINVFDLSALFNHIFTTEARVYRRYLDSHRFNNKEYESMRIGDIHGHPALAYKARRRDDGGFYSMGVIVCAHRKAYIFEDYSHYSPYADWQNDERTYYFPQAQRYPQNFTVDDMYRIETRFFITTFVLYLVFYATFVAAYRMFTRGFHTHGQPPAPILNRQAKQRHDLMVTMCAIVAIIMMVMLVAFWQFRGTKVLQSVAYVVAGLMQLSINLPILIHLYRKARLPKPASRL